MGSAGALNFYDAHKRPLLHLQGAGSCWEGHQPIQGINGSDFEVAAWQKVGRFHWYLNCCGKKTLTLTLGRRIMIEVGKYTINLGNHWGAPPAKVGASLFRTNTMEAQRQVDKDSILQWYWREVLCMNCQLKESLAFHRGQLIDTHECPDCGCRELRVIWNGLSFTEQITW